MKNIFRFLMAVAVLFTASCAKEDISSSIGGGEVEVTFTANLPELGTRAYGEGKLVDILYYNVYEQGTDNKLDLSGYQKAQTQGQSLYTITLPMIKGMKYDIVFWAQVEDCGYYTLDGKTVTVNYAGEANDESRDAFFGKVVEFDPVNPDDMTSVELRRPFAQLNAITNDCQAVLKSSISEMYKSSLKVTTPVCNTLNLLTGTASGEASVEYTLGDIPAETKTIIKDETTEMHLAMNYLLVNGEKSLVDVEFTFVGLRGTVEFPFTTVELGNIPVQRNYRTNIIGKLLTKTTDFEVEIKPGFDTPDQEPNALVKAAINGGEFTLTEDVVLESPLNILADLTINLNGKTISAAVAKGDGAVIEIAEGAKAVISGGTVKSTNENGDAAINNAGELVLQNVTIEGAPLADGGYSAYAVISSGNLVIEEGTAVSADRGCLKFSGDGETVINGGHFTNKDIGTKSLTSHVVDVEDGGTHKLTINGGTFEHLHSATSGGVVICNRTRGTVHVNGGNYSGGNYNGYNNLSDYGYGGTFAVTGGIYTSKPADKYIVTGYKAVEKNGLYYVVAEGATVVANKDEIKDALTTAIGAGETNVVIDAGGANIGDLSYGLSSSKIPAGTTVTLCNANVVGSSYGNGVNGTVIFENCTFNNPNGAYSIHFDNGSGDVIFKNCKLYGWNSFGASLHSVSFEGCSLNGNGTYALIRSYVALSLTDCVINTTNADATDVYSEGVEAVNGATLTETNVVYVIDDKATLGNILSNGADNLSIILDAGSYTIPDSAQGKTLTFEGNGDVEIISENDGAAEGNCDYCFRGSKVTFKNITITTTGTYFPGYANMEGTFENCTINGVYTTYMSSSFKNCTFNVSGDLYNLWTWGAENVTLDGCTFNCDGKAVLLYGGADTQLTVNNCVFNDNGGLTDLKAAIEIGSGYGKSYELIVNNTTVNGFEINDKGINTGTTLWANKNSMGTDELNVIVDGVDVY